MTFFGVHSREKATDALAEHSKSWLRSKHATWVLAIIAFAESFIVPILIDPFLIALILASPKKWKLYVVVSTIASVIGGITAYMLGSVFFETFGTKLLEIYSLEETFQSIASGFDQNGFVFVFIGAFTPIPYKIIAIASGFLHISFLTFVVASIFGRALRLGLVGYATHAVGPKALPVVRRNLYKIATVTGIILLVYFAIRILF